MLRCRRRWRLFFLQCALVFLLAPLLALIAVVFLAIGVVVFAPSVRRAQLFGVAMGDAHLSLLDSTAQFLGGLKLAISQNLQLRFAAESGRSPRRPAGTFIPSQSTRH